MHYILIFFITTFLGVTLQVDDLTLTDKIAWHDVTKKYRERLPVHIHIPKAGGSTLDSILCRSFPRTVDTTQKNQGNSLGQVPLTYFKQRYLSIPGANRKNIQHIHGHSCPSIADFLKTQGVTPSCFSLLRKPITQVLSSISYNFQVVHKKKILHKRELIVEFCRKLHNKGPLLNNPQVHYLAHNEESDPQNVKFDRRDRKFLNTAKARIENDFVLIGLMERYDEFIVMLSKIMGWSFREVLYVKQNVAQNLGIITITENDLPLEAKKELKKSIALDEELYQWAEDRFNKLIELYDNEFGEGQFAKDVAEFKEMNNPEHVLENMLAPDYNFLDYVLANPDLLAWRNNPIDQIISYAKDHFKENAAREGRPLISTQIPYDFDIEQHLQEHWDELKSYNNLPETERDFYVKAHYLKTKL